MRDTGVHAGGFNGSTPSCPPPKNDDLVPSVVLITGSGRSGSTLVERALGEVEGIVNVGELTDLCLRVAPKNERCGCGNAFSECSFWSLVGKHAFGGWNDDVLEHMKFLHEHVVRQRNFPRLFAGRNQDIVRQAGDYASFYRSLYTAIAAVSGSNVVVDASKLPSHALGLTYSSLDLKMVHVTRDPRGVAFSMSKRVVRPHGNGGDDLMWHQSPTASAARWCATQVESMVLGRELVSSTHLNYESFVRNPRSEIVRVLVDLGIRIDKVPSALGSNHMHLSMSHGLSGNHSRFRDGPVALVTDDKWKNEMSRGSRFMVTAITAPVRGSMSIRQRRATEAVRVMEPARARVSAIVVTHGRPEMVQQAVAAVVTQDYAGEIECIVVHDQEEPNYELERLARPGRTIRVVKNMRLPGLPGARNTGIELATGEYVATCDDDDLWYQSKIRRQMDRLSQDPALLLVGSGIRLVFPEGRSRVWSGHPARASHSFLLRNRVKELHSSTLLVYKDAYAKAGLYDEDLPRGYGEDYDWILRASRVGRLGVVRQPLANIAKAGSSYFRDPAQALAGLEALAERHPEIVKSRRGHARLLGQIAYAQVSVGQRHIGLQNVRTGLSRWPLSPYPYVALLQFGLSAWPHTTSAIARGFGRGVI